MPRALGGVPVVNIQANNIQYAWFVKIEIPAGSFIYYTDKSSDYVDASHNINGVDTPTWSSYDIKIGPLVQNQISPLDVSYIEIENLDNVWSTYMLTNGTRFRSIQIYMAWFDPITDAFLGSMKVFDGRSDECTLGSRIRMSLVPHRTPWNALVPARRFLPTCQYLFKDTSTCQYGVLAPPASQTLSQVGGSLGAGTYFYQITAVGFGGESLGSTETSITIIASHGINITWTAVPFAKSYNIYGRVTGSSKLKITNILASAPLAFVDSGAITPAGALPVSNTTGLATTCQRIQAACVTNQNEGHFGGFLELPPPNFKLVWGSIAVVIPQQSGGNGVYYPLAQNPPLEERMTPVVIDRGNRDTHVVTFR